MTNSRFREIEPGVTVEMIATRIDFSYTPGGQGDLRAVWWAQEYLPVSAGFQRLGVRGERLTTRLSDYADHVLQVTDPITGHPVSLSAAGAAEWLKAWFDYQYNLEHPAEAAPPAP